MNNNEKLRFAPIIRVSTDIQEKQGESLKTQETQIIEFVESLGGIIPEYCWRYKGQEHATPNQERSKMDQLLADAGKDIFDAVICCDLSRWSRDNLKSKEGLNILRKHKIKFFVGRTEYDINKPSEILVIGMNAEIGEFLAREQSRKSMESRIHRAKRGIPSAGNLPYGRTWDKEKGWDVDPIKKKLIERAAKLYINAKKGEGIPTIAKLIGMSPANLHKILTLHSGTECIQSFENEALNIHEKVVIKVPELLDEETIKKIGEKLHNNISYERGNKKWYHLLQGMAYCKICGYKMSSVHKPSGKEYYRHSPAHRSCKFNKYVPATELENSVLLLLVKTFGDSDMIERAIKRAMPDLEQRKELEEEKNQLLDAKTELGKERENLIRSVRKGLLSDNDILREKNRIDSQLNAIQIRLNTIDLELGPKPNQEHIKALSRWAGKVSFDASKDNPEIIYKRPYQWKRKLIEKAFTGVSPDGTPLGVYLDLGEKEGSFTFELRGLFENTISSLPLTDDQLMNIFHFDSEYQDVSEEINKAKLNLAGKSTGKSSGRELVFCQRSAH